MEGIILNLSIPKRFTTITSIRNGMTLDRELFT